MARPIIAITGPARRAHGPRWCVAIAVRLYGGVPLQVRPGDDWSASEYDGVVVTGGHDIDPVLYAAEAEVEPRHDRARDALELAVIRDALERDLPLLGICRGAQLLNVCRGGTLVQDLRPHRRLTSHRRTVLPLKTLCVDDGTGLARLLGPGNIKINSLHNQAINRLGEGLRVAAHDLDGIVQAVEDPAARFLVGVQWHPEFLILLRRQRRLFEALVKCARAY
ncbi:MAG: gamma-glutamyl-gamma-aminobutyrate hydrolase family protein [Gammaproteobacteria bacterium]